MPPSFRTVNYSLRPAKQIERRMLAEALLRLTEFGSLTSYRYVGLGGIHFKDFVVFHRLLGISNMVSIEKEALARSRFEFNQPFACVKIEFESTSKVLPKLAWDIRTILWLDFDERLTASALSDISVFCARASSGSVLIVSVQAQDEHDNVDPLAALIESIGPERVPNGTKRSDFTAWGTATLFRRIVINEIASRLHARNAGRAAGTRFVFRQIFNFQYRDGARMLTVGGILHDEGQAPNVAKCGFESLDFVRTSDEPYRIEVPVLTPRELRDLDRLLPGITPGQIQEHPVPNGDIEKYASIYRFFPTFAEVEP